MSNNTYYISPRVRFCDIDGRGGDIGEGTQRVSEYWNVALSKTFKPVRIVHEISSKPPVSRSPHPSPLIIIHFFLTFR